MEFEDAVESQADKSSTSTRSTELREENRRVFAWSLGIAVLAHVAVLAFSPTFRAELITGSDIELESVSEGGSTRVAVDVFFGPPDIFEANGTLSRESPDRVLEAKRALGLPAECAALDHKGQTPAHGQVRLTLNASGRVDAAELVESTGDPCGDESMVAVANALWYHWLPSDRFPALVELIQPITIALAQN